MSFTKRTQWTLVAAIILLSASMLACALTSSSSSSNADPISDVVLSKDVQGDNYDPVDVTETFPSDQKIIHAVVTLEDAPKDTQVRAVWQVVDAGDSSQNGDTIDSAEVTTDGSRNVDFTLEPNNPLPAGTYKVVVYLNGKKNQSLEFTIEGERPAPAPTAAPEQPTAPPAQPTTAPAPTAAPAGGSELITAAVMAQDVQGDNFDPVGVTNTFPASQPVYHAVVTIENAPDGTAFKANWKVVDIGSAGTPGQSMGEYTITAGGSRNLDFSFKPDNQLPPGQYQVEIYVNGSLARTLDFTVQPSQPTPAAKLSGYILDVTFAKDVQGSNLDPVNTTTVFNPGDTIHAVVATNNAPKDTQFKADWYVVDIGDASQANKLIASSVLSASGTRNLDFKLTPTSSWPSGTYRVEISVNGQVEYTGEYTVQ
jgi:hypothetical protein